MPQTDTNVRVAREVMGWEICPVEEPFRPHLCLVGDDKIKHLREIPDFAHSLDACTLAEAEIERRGLMKAYCFELARLAKEKATSLDWAFEIYLIRLTPEQRCAAMLKAVEHV